MIKLRDVSVRVSLEEPVSLLSISEHIHELLGYAHADFLTGKITLQAIIHPHDKDIADELFSSNINPPSRTFNIRLRQANGHIRCIKGHYTKKQDDSSLALVLELLLQDAKSLFTSHPDVSVMPNFRAMMENSDDYIYFKDRNHVFTGASQTLVQITEPSEHWTDLLGLTDYDVFPEEYADIYYSLEKQVFSGINVAHEAQETLDNAGSEGWVDNRKYPIHDESGEIIGLFWIARDITELKESARKLAESETRFHHLLQNIPSVSVQGYRLDGTTIYWNEASEKLYGYTTEQAVGQNLLDLIIPEEMTDLVKSGMQFMVESGEAIPPSELLLKRHDDSRVPVYSSHAIIQSGEGIPELFCIDIDLTKQKQAEEELQHKQVLLQTAQKAAGFGVYTTDIEAGRWTNDAVFDEIFGIDENFDRSFKNWEHVIIHPDDRRRVLAELFTVIKKQVQLSSVEHRIIRPSDGELRWIGAWGYNEYGADGSIINQVGVIQDITERKKVEGELQLSARVFSDTHEGITITDANKIIVDVNPAFCEITGFNREEIIGLNPSVLSAGKQSPEFYQDMWQQIHKHGHWQGEIWNRRKNGEFYAELLTISALKNEHNEVVNYVGVFTDITNIKEQQEQLSLMAHYDALTGLPNRVLFVDRFNQAVAHSNRTGKQLAVCFLDLDNFKPVNDDFGHDVGDELLIEVAKRITASIREEDTVSRQGGDEFTILLGEISSIKQCEHTLGRIHHALAEPFFIDGQHHKISASSGFTLYPSDDADLDTLLRHADRAMYQAKVEGKHRYHLFSLERDRQTIKKHHRIDEVVRALNNDEFELYYQPKVNMATGHVYGAEALIRWNHPDKGLVPPLDFLPVIEETELEIKVGEWVIDHALKQLLDWQQQDLKLAVSVNISSLHILSKDFVEQLEAMLARYPTVSANRLELEILESSALGDIGAVRTVIKTCQNRLGVKVALDDFGTGYSSLSHLRGLSADSIKIDQSFVRDMLGDASDATIIDAVIGLADSFNLGIIAEGVETTEHGLMLLIMGCEQAQGYGIAKPMPADKLLVWLSDYRPNKAWQTCGNKFRTAQEDKVELFRLITRHWKAYFEAIIQSSPEELKRWPVMCSNNCPCDLWIKRAKQEQLFDKEVLQSLDDGHKALHAVAKTMQSKYQEGKLEMARAMLVEFQKAFGEMNDALSRCK